MMQGTAKGDKFAPLLAKVDCLYMCSAVHCCRFLFQVFAEALQQHRRDLQSSSLLAQPRFQLQAQGSFKLVSHQILDSSHRMILCSPSSLACLLAIAAVTASCKMCMNEDA